MGTKLSEFQIDPDINIQRLFLNKILLENSSTVKPLD